MLNESPRLVTNTEGQDDWAEPESEEGTVTLTVVVLVVTVVVHVPARRPASLFAYSNSAHFTDTKQPNIKVRKKVEGNSEN